MAQATEAYNQPIQKPHISFTGRLLVLLLTLKKDGLGSRKHRIRLKYNILFFKSFQQKTFIIYHMHANKLVHLT